jgi:hypothetical protein
MLSLALSAVVLGGLANLALALIHLLGVKALKPTPNAGVSTVRLMNLRSVYLYAFFAALSFAFPRPLVTTALGIAVSSGIGGFLAVQTVILLLSPEFHPKTNLRAPCVVIGLVCYAYSVYAGLNI